MLKSDLLDGNCLISRLVDALVDNTVSSFSKFVKLLVLLFDFLWRCHLGVLSAWAL